MAHTSGRIRFATAGGEPGQAPVSGGEPGAVEASLSIMVGGEAADFEAAKPVLEAVGKTIVHVGPAGSGQTVKAANQLIVAGNIELLAEAIVFLEAYGVDTEAVAATSAVARPHRSHAGPTSCMQTSNRDVVVSGTELNSVDGHRRRHGR